MTPSYEFPYDVSKVFPHLSKAPIAEAIIGIDAIPSVAMDPEILAQGLDGRIGGYSHLDDHRRFQAQFEVSQDNNQQKAISQDLGWQTTRYKSDDGNIIFGMGVEGLSVSELEPYSDWAAFSRRAVELWENFVDIAKPDEISRIGLRYINEIQIPEGSVELLDYLKNPPAPLVHPEGVRQTGFLYQDRLIFDRYIASWTRTAGHKGEAPAILVDIDVSINEPQKTGSKELTEHLSNMRWIKNTLFFETLAESYMEKLK